MPKLSPVGSTAKAKQPAKAPNSPAKGRKTTPQAPQRSLVEIVADAADAEGVLAIDLLKFSEWMQRQGITEHVSRTTAHDADKLNRERINSLLHKYNRQEQIYSQVEQ